MGIPRGTHYEHRQDALRHRHLEATTDWEPNYYEGNDFGKPEDSTFQPKDLEVIMRGYMETDVGREHVTVKALTDALAGAGFEDSVTEEVMAALVAK